MAARAPAVMSAGMEAEEGKRARGLMVYFPFLSPLSTMSGGQPQLQEMPMTEGFQLDTLSHSGNKVKHQDSINKEERESGY